MNHCILKRIVAVVLLFIFCSFQAISSDYSKKKKRKDFPVLVIGPEVGASFIMGFYEEGEMSAYFNYSLGGFLNIRPIKQIGIMSGFKFVSIVNVQKFYELPILFQLYFDETSNITIGPSILYDIHENNTIYKNSKIGFTVGGGGQLGGIFFSYYPYYTELIETQNLNFLIGVGVSIRLGLLSK